MMLLKHPDGTLNAFQPVHGGFRFIGDQNDAKRWIRHNIATLRKLEEKYDAHTMLTRLFKSVIDFEMIEDLYVACMKVREDESQRQTDR